MAIRYATVVLVVGLTPCLSSRAQEHLEPERTILNEPGWEWDYAKSMREVLLKDSGTWYLARMICLPSFEPEWVVTVVREDGEDIDAPHSSSWSM